MPSQRLEHLVERTDNIQWQDAESKEFRYIDLTSVDRMTHTICATETIDRVSAPDRAKRIVRENDVIFGTTRPMLKRYSQIPKEYDQQICSTGFCVLRPKRERLLANFLVHLLGTESFYAYVDANQRGASYPAISDGDVKAFSAPVPPLEVQQEIVSILDKFDTLVNDLSSGLPAEINARRKQYEYYRDTLLTFREAT